MCNQPFFSSEMFSCLCVAEILASDGLLFRGGTANLRPPLLVSPEIYCDRLLITCTQTNRTDFWQHFSIQSN